jgi:predicted nucleotidyltransferase
VRLDRSFDDLFQGRSHVRVLRALEELPEGLAVSARELARRSGLSHPTVLSVLASLLDQGVVLARRAPRADAFELNRRHVLVEKVGALFEWERGLPTEFMGFLREELKRHAKGSRAAYLFGSVTQGEMTPASDVDIAVVSTLESVEEIEVGMGRVAEAVRERFGNRLSVILGLWPVERLTRPGQKGSRLWARILREGIPVLAGPAP